MLRLLFSVAVAALAAQASAQSGGWQLLSEAGGRDLTLLYGSDQPHSYRFACTLDAVVITQTGVTELMDFATGKPVGDEGNAVMPQTAAMMALYTGSGDPDFQPARAVKNPAGGWDLTIAMPRNDKRLTAAGKSGMLSLFTSGYTAAVIMDASSRALWKDFLKRCRSAR